MTWAGGLLLTGKDLFLPARSEEDHRSGEPQLLSNGRRRTGSPPSRSSASIPLRRRGSLRLILRGRHRRSSRHEAKRWALATTRRDSSTISNSSSSSSSNFRSRCFRAASLRVTFASAKNPAGQPWPASDGRRGSAFNPRGYQHCASQRHYPTRHHLRHWLDALYGRRLVGSAGAARRRRRKCCWYLLPQRRSREGVGNDHCHAMRVFELRQLCRGHGITIGNKGTKLGLIRLLKEHDVASTDAGAVRESITGDGSGGSRCSAGGSGSSGGSSKSDGSSGDRSSGRAGGSGRGQVGAAAGGGGRGPRASSPATPRQTLNCRLRLLSILMGEECRDAFLCHELQKCRDGRG
ncbi:unnamed protein product [Phaeothamnion confervicola]